MTKKSGERLAALSLVELLVVIAMLAILFTAGFTIFRLAIRTVDQAQNYAQAELLAQDLIELTISKRNEDWNSLIPGTYYFTVADQAGIEFAAGSENVDIFERNVLLEAVSRDGGGTIVTSGGTVDLDSMKATATVTWESSGKDYEVKLVEYLTNWRRF